MGNRAVTEIAETAFGALADPTRRAVLDLLRRASLPAGDIARAFPVSRPALSRHLRVLRRARLVRERREGRRRVYELTPSPLKAVDAWISEYRKFWEANLGDLKTFVEREQATRRARRPTRRNSR
jgi:DNA-binding transcriptional ArsR family regulator